MLIEWGEIKAALLVHCNIIYEAFANNSIGLHVAYSTNTLIFWGGKLESPECFSLHFQVGWLVIFLKQQNNSSQWLKHQSHCK